MTYLQDRQRKKDQYIKVTLIVIIATLLIFGITKVKKFLFPVSNTILGSGSNLMDAVKSSIINKTTTKTALKNKILVLESENQFLKTKESVYGLQETELNEMRTALDLKASYEKIVFGNISSTLSSYGTFLIKVSGSSGIKTGNIITDRYGSVVGTVREVNNSIVTALYIDSNTTKSAYLIDSQLETQFSKESRGILVAQLPRDVEVEVGETVVLPGTQTKIGNVIDVSTNEKDPFKKVYTKISAEFNKGDIVGIIIE